MWYLVWVFFFFFPELKCIPPAALPWKIHMIIQWVNIVVELDFLLLKQINERVSLYGKSDCEVTDEFNI